MISPSDSIKSKRASNSRFQLLHLNSSSSASSSSGVPILVLLFLAVGITCLCIWTDLIGIMYRWYLRMLEERPYITKSVSACLIMGGGDALQQGIECYQSGGASTKSFLQRYHERFEPGRAIRMGGYGLIVVGPVMHNWFRVLEYLVPYKSTKGAIGKMVVDQSFMAPLSTAMFFTGMGIAEGENFDEIKRKVKNLFLPTLIANYKVWPAVQFINFFFVPVNLRLLFVNIVGLGYNAFLSSMLSKDKNRQIQIQTTTTTESSSSLNEAGAKYSDVDSEDDTSMNSDNEAQPNTPTSRAARMATKQAQVESYTQPPHEQL